MAAQSDNGGNGVNGIETTVVDPAHELFLHQSDHPNFVLSMQLLNCTNYNPWRRCVEFFLTARNKLSFVNGKSKMPAEDSPLYNQWKRCNGMVISWLLHSVEKDIAETLLYCQSASEIWTELNLRFGDRNSNMIYQVQKELFSVSQGSLPVTAYFTKLKKLWDEYLVLIDMPNCNSCGAINSIPKLLYNQRAIQFLAGLNDAYAAVRGNILMMRPKPSLNEMYHSVLQEEKHRDWNNSPRSVKIAHSSSTSQCCISSPVNSNICRNRDCCMLQEPTSTAVLNKEPHTPSAREQDYQLVALLSSQNVSPNQDDDVRNSIILDDLLIAEMEGINPEEPRHDERRDMNEVMVDGDEFFTSSCEVYESFDSMCLQENLLKGIYAYGFNKPSAIQQIGIVPFSKGLNVIEQAQFEVGRSATFCCGILQQLDYSLIHCQALVLAPTRQLVQLTKTLMRALGHYLGVKVYACAAGMSICENQPILHRAAHVIVGTPGSVLNMLRRNSFTTDHIKMVVLDEADEMLSGGGLKDQMGDIFLILPPKIQVGVFSATMPPDVLEVTQRLMSKPVRILVKQDELTLEGIKQFYVKVDWIGYKPETLDDLYKTFTITKSVVFVNTGREVEWVTDFMSRSGHMVSAIHDDMNQKTKDSIMQDFRSGSLGALITTDSLAPSFDKEQISWVINYDLPSKVENYLKRIGRSRRFINTEGAAAVINLITNDQVMKMVDIESLYNVCIDELPDHYLDIV